MFTGIIEGIGTVTAAARAGGGLQLRIRLGELADGLTLGASVAVEGVCLTVISLAGQEATFDAGEETLQRTTLGAVRPGTRVNLERPLTPDKPIGGHFVQGHVDGIGRLASVTQRPGGRLVQVSVAPEIARQLVAKGSVAVDGISLTVVDVGDDHFTSFLIPHTFAETTLAAKRPGDAVNIETDIIGKYVARYLGRSAGTGLTEEKLREHGFI